MQFNFEEEWEKKYSAEQGSIYKEEDDKDDISSMTLVQRREFDDISSTTLVQPQ